MAFLRKQESIWTPAFAGVTIVGYETSSNSLYPQKPMLTGYAESVITPKVPCDLSGYGYYAGRKAKSVLDDLKVKSVFLQDSRHNKILIISFDLIGFSIAFCDSFRRLISSRFKIPFPNIMISCTHTHSGPPTINLRGMGRINSGYLADLKKKTLKIIRAALSQPHKTEIKWRIARIPTIGFNRVIPHRRLIDDYLGVIILRTPRQNIYLVNFACHPAVLGPNTAISADFPGRFARAVERQSDKLVFLQGFCGDIDPLVNKKEWGKGTESDIDSYGEHLARCLFKSSRQSRPLKKLFLSAVEKRIRISFQLPGRKELEREKQSLISGHQVNKNYLKFMNTWLKNARNKLAGLKKNPYLENIPLQVIKIGELNLIGWPAEVFCGTGLKIKKKFARSLTIGYTNGVIGYVAPKEVYRNRQDYACYIAPKLYLDFPFAPETETIFSRETERIMKTLYDRISD